MKSKDEIEAKRLEIDSIRQMDHRQLGLDDFTRGHLAGAQQALWWVLDLGMEPVRATLSDAALEALEALKEAVSTGGLTGEKEE